VFGVAYEIALDEQQGGIGLESLDDHDVLAFGGVAGLAPFDLFGEAAAKGDLA